HVPCWSTGFALQPLVATNVVSTDRPYVSKENRGRFKFMHYRHSAPRRVDGLSPSAKLEIFDLLGPEYLYQLNGAENIYLIHLADYGFPGMDLKRHSTSDGYDFAVKSSLYMLLEDEYDETAMPFGTVTLSPLKDGFLRHLSALEGDVAFVDVATKWTVPLMID
ncbi:hypothetical protein AAVH_37040, partial [Aphelenchoides avenae]